MDGVTAMIKFDFELVNVPGHEMAIPNALSCCMVGLIDADQGRGWSRNEQVQIIQQCHAELGHAHWKMVYQTMKDWVQWPGL